MQPSWDQYGDAMGCYAPGAVDKESLREMDVDPGRVPDADQLLADWANLIWDQLSCTDILGDALAEALELEGIHDLDAVAVEREETAIVADPADPLGLSMGDGAVPGVAR